MPTAFGRYQLLRRVGAGGMAEVYKAVAQGPAGFEKVLAIKKVLPGLSEDPAFVEMFVEEAKLAASLVHPNIVPVFDFGQVAGDYYIGMEYISGCSLGLLLHRLARNNERLPPECAYLVAVEVARGLGYAHRQREGLVHRDVSPANILISFGGEVKLTDFGIAKAENIASRTEAGLVRGKVAFMSPEQAAGTPLDGRSDLFSLGSVIFQCLCGKRLFDSDSEPALFNALAAYQRPSEALLAKMPEAARPVVLKALAGRAADRYPDGDSMARAFEALLGTGITDSRAVLAKLVQRLFDPERQADLADAEETDTRPSAPGGDASAALDTHDAGLNRLIPEIAGFQPRVFEARPFRSASGREAKLELEEPRPAPAPEPSDSGDLPPSPGSAQVSMRTWAIGGGVVAFAALVVLGWLWFSNRAAAHQAELSRCGATWGARVAMTRSLMEKLDRDLAGEQALKVSYDSDLALVSTHQAECFQDGAAWRAAEKSAPKSRVKPDAEVLGESADGVVGRLSFPRSAARLPEILQRIAGPGVEVDRLEVTIPRGSHALTVHAQINACRKQGPPPSGASAPPIDPALEAAMKPAPPPEACAGLTDFSSEAPSTLENLRQVLAAHDPDARRLAALKANAARTAPLATTVRAFHDKRDAHLAIFRDNLEELASRAADNGFAALEVDTLGLPRWNSEDEVPAAEQELPVAAVVPTRRPVVTGTPARVAVAAPAATADPNVPGSRFGANPRVDRYDEKFAALDVGHKYLDQWKTAEADREYRKIVKQWDDFPDGHYWYGISGELQGDRARACHEFSRYLELSPYGYYVASARKHSATCH